MTPIRFDNSLLEEVGLGDLPDDDKTILLRYVLEVMEIRLGDKLAAGLSDDQLQEFYKYAQGKQTSKARAWIEEHIPNYSQIISKELAAVKKELKSSATQILGEARGRQAKT